ncbi:MAG: NFACT RNA binding domain-containing protein [Rhodothermales bacterium]
MISNYFTLRALVQEWQPHLVGTQLGDAFSQQPDELTIAHTSEKEDGMIRLSVRAPLRYIFRVAGYSKARRNVAALFPDAVGRPIVSVRLAHRDRMIFIDLEGGFTVRIVLFGPRANVFLVGPEGKIVDAFQRRSEVVGDEPPTPRPAPVVASHESFLLRWDAERKSVVQALSSAMPLFDRSLSEVAAERAGLDPNGTPRLESREIALLYDAARDLEDDLERPAARIYWRGEFALAFSLVSLPNPSNLTEERFPSVDEAVRIFVRRSLAQRNLSQLHDPLQKSLENAAKQYRASSERLLEELSSESRADRYEKWGHLLMAAPQAVPAGAKSVEVDDLFLGGRLSIQLDPALSAIENARIYYDRARRTRRARDEAEMRLLKTEQTAQEAEKLLVEFRTVTTPRDIEAFRRDRAEVLSRILRDQNSDASSAPFRRFQLEGAYEVWVGRNARENDDLTFHHAQKYDLWMHARGVPGSHVILRLPNRNARPDRHLIEKAASIAAYFSKARGSSLVPVIVAERKFVRKRKGAAPGAVVVDREDVVLAEPGLPE